MQEINRLTQNYNINIEMLIEHLKDSSISTETKLIDFSIINNSIGFLSREIIQTAKFIYGTNSNVGPSLLHYVKRALDFYQLSEDHMNSKDYYINLKKHEDIIAPVLNDYFKHTNIISTEEAILLAYKLISYEIGKSDSGVRRNLIKLKS